MLYCAHRLELTKIVSSLEIEKPWYWQRFLWGGVRNAGVCPPAQTPGPSACYCPLWIVGVSQMFGTMVMSGKYGCDLCIRLAAFVRGTLLLLPRTSDGKLWLFRWVFGRHWQLMQWVSPSLQGRCCCYGDKWEPGKLVLCFNNSLMSAERFGDINVNCRYSGFIIVCVPVPLWLCHPPSKSSHYSDWLHIVCEQNLGDCVVFHRSSPVCVCMRVRAHTHFQKPNCLLCCF